MNIVRDIVDPTGELICGVRRELHKDDIDKLWNMRISHPISGHLGTLLNNGVKGEVNDGRPT